MVARAASQTAIEDAEARARIAREKHEKSTKELEQELAKAKVLFRADASTLSGLAVLFLRIEIGDGRRSKRQQ